MSGKCPVTAGKIPLASVGAAAGGAAAVAGTASQLGAASATASPSPTIMSYLPQPTPIPVIVPSATSPYAPGPPSVIANGLNSGIGVIQSQRHTVLEPGSLILAPPRSGFFHKLIFGNLKYKVLTTILLCGGAYAFVKYMQRTEEEEEERKEVEEKYKEDPFEDEITYLEMDERSLCRRIVSNFWIPSIIDMGKKPGMLDSMQTTKDIEESQRGKVWHYAELDTEQIPTFQEEYDAAMPDELRFILKVTRLLGHFDKKSMLATWKNIDSMELQRGDYLFTHGEPDIFVYIVLQGSIQLIVNDPEALAREKYKRPYLALKKVTAGQHIYSTLSFLETMCGHPSTYDCVEAFALEDSVVLKLPVEDFRQNWFERPKEMKAAVCRLVRRIYQTVFVSMHRKMGLSFEICNQTARKPIDPEYIADQSTAVSAELKNKIVAAARHFFEMEDPQFDEYFNECEAIILPRGANPGKAGTRSVKLIYVYEGELEITSAMEFSDLELKEVNAKKEDVANMEETLYFVPANEAVGGLSYLTDDINIFNVRVPDKVTLFVMPEETIVRLVSDYPLMILKIAYTVVLRLSAFMRQIDFGLEWTFVESGESLFNVGDDPDYTYLVLSGRLRSFVPNEKGKLRMLTEYGRDDWIGLVETLSKKKRSKAVIAVRDTELTKIPHGLLHFIKLKHPIVTMRLMDYVATRVAKTYNIQTVSDKAADGSSPSAASLIHGPRGCSTITLVPCRDQTPTLCVAYELYLAYTQRYGQAGIVTHADLIEALGPNALSKSNDYLLTNWMSNQEERYSLVIYIAEPEPNRWTMKCVRQADIIFILINTLSDPWDVSLVELLINKEAPAAKKEVIFLHRFYTPVPNKPPRVYPQDSKAWLEKRPWLNFHHHVGLRDKAAAFLNEDLTTIERKYLTDSEMEADIYSDYSRISRWISGNAVGLVLGGGGAKGAAHLGIIRVLREHKIPIDMLSGVSIGSFVGGLYALHQDIDAVEISSRIWFDNIGSAWRALLDLTVPFTAILRGESFNFTVRQAMGEVQIEDLWLPYFCLTTNITANCSRTHRSGMLWRYCRASMTLSMLNPPMCDPLDGHYLMDGGYTNLVPANVMRQVGAKFIMAVDVSSQGEKVTTNYGDSLSGVKILLHKILPFTKPLFVPTYFGVIEQLSYVQSTLYLEIIKKMDRQTLYIRPPLDHFTGADFNSYRDILLIGYDFAKKLMRHVEDGDSLLATWQKIFDNLPVVEAKPGVRQNKEADNPDMSLPTKEEVQEALKRLRDSLTKEDELEPNPSKLILPGFAPVPRRSRALSVQFEIHNE